LILYEILGSEDHPVYQNVHVENGRRHYDFLRSMVAASLDVQRPFLSQTLLKALNFHAIAGLHHSAGEFRPCDVVVGSHEPPAFHRVQTLMDDFVNEVNRSWGEDSDPVNLSTYVLWRLNYIHPFINGNGRTARAACYFILCVASGGWLRGRQILPELLRRERDDLCSALESADASWAKRELDLTALHTLVSRLLEEQFSED